MIFVYPSIYLLTYIPVNLSLYLTIYLLLVQLLLVWLSCPSFNLVKNCWWLYNFFSFLVLEIFCGWVFFFLERCFFLNLYMYISIYSTCLKFLPHSFSLSFCYFGSINNQRKNKILADSVTFEYFCVPFIDFLYKICKSPTIGILLFFFNI